ncbi:MAG: response regulator transcription factor [Candidatus Pacebacteria bacterium]|nr:response regulator transcription factor [Candidatus Paceibacterota bacterium]
MRFLIIDNTRDDHSIIKNFLQSKNYTVDVVKDIPKGLSLAETYQYNVIVIKDNPPETPGSYICCELRQMGITVPIIVASTSSNPCDIVEALDYGADDYVSKPFYFDEFFARIRALLRRPCNIQSDILQAHNIILDTRCCTVKKNKKDIYLTRKEFGLLEYLLRNKGMVVCRSMIMENVWDVNGDPFSKTIESHIRSLRKKLETTRHRGIIITVPGRGYKIQD